MCSIEGDVMDAELKECPFCGGKPIMSKKCLDERFGYADQVMIHCGSCGVGKNALGDVSKPGYADNSTTEKRAIEAWNQRPAIAPPVAAGSVDIAELRLMLIDHRHSDSRKEQDGHLDSIIYFVNAWAAQQREAGRQEGALASLGNYDAACEEHRKQIAVLTECAEKAEADLKQVNEWRAAALVSNQQLYELMEEKLAKAEARAAHLEHFFKHHSVQVPPQYTALHTMEDSSADRK